MNEMEKSDFIAWTCHGKEYMPPSSGNIEIPGKLCKQYPWCELVWQHELTRLSGFSLPFFEKALTMNSIRIFQRDKLWQTFHEEAIQVCQQVTEDLEKEKITAAEGIKKSEVSPERRIEEFLEKAPKILPGDTTSFVADLTSSNREEDNMVTETLAEVYTLQGHREKAIAIYKKLILKFPEKSAYFADRINAL